MKMSLRGWFVMGTLAALVMGLVVSGTPLRSAENEQAGSPQGRLTHESLGSLLEAMGLKTQKVEKRYDFQFQAIHEEQEWELSMSAVLSQNGESLWVMAWLDELPRSAAKVPRTALLRLLADNDRMGNGKFFAYIPSNRRFVLQRTIPNENLTTAAVREILRDLGTSVVETYPHWSVDHWTSADRTAGQPAEQN